MKIAYLANVRIPSERAHATQIVHMCQALTESGNILDLYVNTRTKGSAVDIGKQYDMSIKFAVIRLSHGFLKPGWRWTFYFSELFFTLNFILTKKSDYDIYYARSEWIVWLLSFFISSKKLCWESHEAKLNYPAKQIIKKQIKIVTISEGIFDEYLPFVKSRSQLCVAHDGIDSSFFEALETRYESRERLGLDQKKQIVMYIGGFDLWKGVETFFESSNIDSERLFVAIGGSKEEIKKLRKKYPNVQFLGHRPYADLRHNQQSADVLVIPNTAKIKLSSLYTSPLKLFAHMSSGVPLVVSEVPSITSVSGSEKVTTFIPDSHTSLAEVIKNVFADYILKKENANHVREEVKKYLWVRRAEDVVRFITDSK